MKNPIREWNKKNSMTAPSYETIEKWADQMDALLNPWVSVDKCPKHNNTALMTDGEKTCFGHFNKCIWIHYNIIIEPTHYMEIPDLPPPDKGGE